MKSIYKSPIARQQSMDLYNRQMKKLGMDYNDIYIRTSFGKTHLIETGNRDGKPLLVFHGGNSTTAYNLLMTRFLLNDFHIYAVDIIGHPGKSSQMVLSPFNYDYGIWASDVIKGLGFDKMLCFGGSYGGGVLAKLMCVAPGRVERAVLVVPSGISNAFPINTAKMMIPLMKYRITKQERYVKETALYMSVTEDALDENTLETVKDSFDHVKTKISMPSNVSGMMMKECKAPTLVMAGEKDCLFPAAQVLRRAKKIIPDCKVHMLKGRGHMHIMTEREKKIIIDFLKD